MAHLLRKPPLHQGDRKPDVEKVFGRGLVEPVDDWRDDTEASIPELLDHLEKLMVRVDYDLRYIRTWSPGLDVYIILRTIALIFRDRAAY